MEIWTVVAIIGGVSLCLLGHQLARKAAGSSDPEQSQTVAWRNEPQPSEVRRMEEYR